MERIRILISQIISGIVIATLAMWFCRGVMMNTGLINRFYSYQINSVSITLLVGLLVIVLLAVKLILWLIKEPNQGQIDIEKIENIPEENKQ